MSKQFEVKVLKNRFKVYGRQSQKTYQTALMDCLDDLVRTSSQSAPHDEGILEKSWTKEIQFSGNRPSGLVSYSVKKGGKNGNFNYAMRMHEDESYNLGPKSLAKGGGVGMSGKQYKVGTGYLGEVLKGEQRTYGKHIEKSLKSFSNKF